MTKQEEIREGIDKIIKEWIRSNYPIGKETFCDLVKRIQVFEDSQDVVIKVERELPPIAVVSGDEWSLKQCRWTQEAMLKAGFVAVESLVG